MPKGLGHRDKGTGLKDVMHGATSTAIDLGRTTFPGQVVARMPYSPMFSHTLN
ncbi:hypothetical protein PMI36_05341 [Pseudomonas sp. GM79]|nr:hypothetical protein PMI36_05341 [Pseudomonas sp. GM79]